MFPHGPYQSFMPPLSSHLFPWCFMEHQDDAVAIAFWNPMINYSTWLVIETSTSKKMYVIIAVLRYHVLRSCHSQHSVLEYTNMNIIIISNNIYSFFGVVHIINRKNTTSKDYLYIHIYMYVFSLRIHNGIQRYLFADKLSFLCIHPWTSFSSDFSRLRRGDLGKGKEISGIREILGVDKAHGTFCAWMTRSWWFNKRWWLSNWDLFCLSSRVGEVNICFFLKPAPRFQMMIYYLNPTFDKLCEKNTFTKMANLRLAKKGSSHKLYKKYPLLKRFLSKCRSYTGHRSEGRS